MSIGIHAASWQFLHPSRAEAYVRMFAQPFEGHAPRPLALSTMRRQFATAREILNRMNQGQRGVLLADDVGLGKTTVAALCALVFAGSGKSVRILAPNAMMERRWRHELAAHIRVVDACTSHLKLEKAMRRLKRNVKRLTAGTIYFSTHQKAEGLNCDLLIVDEAHRTRSDHSKFARGVQRHKRAIGNILVLTATPFSLDPNDLAKLLSRIGGKSAEKPMKNYAKGLEDLWLGRAIGSPEEAAHALVVSAAAAVDVLRPYVIRHGIDDLNEQEKCEFGVLEKGDPDQPLRVPDWLLEAMLRADRALELGNKQSSLKGKRRNDPRYHVALGKLRSDLESLVVKPEIRNANNLRSLCIHHAGTALRKLDRMAVHPKIAETVRITGDIVAKGEKVLIFCDHHQPAAELTRALAEKLRWGKMAKRQSKPVQGLWRATWESILSRPSNTASKPANIRHETRLNNYLNWLLSEGVQAQIESWLNGRQTACQRPADLVRVLDECSARGHEACLSIAQHASELFQELTDPESRSTLSILLGDGARLPGATNVRVAAVCHANGVTGETDHSGIFFDNEPDATLAVFNSPFGPDVLVATDRLSEGVDLHRFCRHLIHHELDPSPVRTIQRNGRIRRVKSWAARTGQGIKIYYPALLGTRDERLVEIMRYRLMQFDMLLGGVRTEIDPDREVANLGYTERVLDHARAQLGSVRLGIELDN